ncbi:MAG: hypothetical protein AAF282_03240 [Cyanobacteria bacterium P01_A01_bin.15]
MAKFHLPKLNSWVTSLVLASIGLHGLVLALPVPDLADLPPEPLEMADPEVIQVVTLPKLTRGAESLAPSLPEPPTEPPPVEEPDELVLLEPELLDEIEPGELDEWDETPAVENQPAGGESGDLEDGSTAAPTLDQQLANIDSYGDYDGEQAGDVYASGKFNRWFNQNLAHAPQELDLDPPLTLPVPVSQCLDHKPKDIGIGVVVAADGSLVNDPAPLGSSGYGVLDKKAIELAREATYPPSAKTEAYWIKVQIEDYTLCPTA